MQGQRRAPRMWLCPPRSQPTWWPPAGSCGTVMPKRRASRAWHRRAAGPSPSPPSAPAATAAARRPGAPGGDGVGVRGSRSPRPCRGGEGNATRCRHRDRVPRAPSYLLGQPGDVLHLAAARAAAQRGVELGQHLGQQGGDVGVQRREPRVRRGRVLAAQDQRVPAVRRVQLDQPAGHRALGRGAGGAAGAAGCVSPPCHRHHPAVHSGAARPSSAWSAAGRGARGRLPAPRGPGEGARRSPGPRPNRRAFPERRRDASREPPRLPLTGSPGRAC